MTAPIHLLDVLHAFHRTCNKAEVFMEALLVHNDTVLGSYALIAQCLDELKSHCRMMEEALNASGKTSH